MCYRHRLLLSLGSQSRTKLADTREKIAAFKATVDKWHTEEEIHLAPLIAVAAAAVKKDPDSLLLPKVELENVLKVDDLVDQELRFRITLQDNEPSSPSKRKYADMVSHEDSETAVTPAPTQKTMSTEESPDSEVGISSLRILLPSDYQACIARHAAMERAVSMERDLRKAMAHEQLDNLRAELVTCFGHRLIGSGLKGQTLKTRAHSALHCKYAAAKKAADAYQRTRVRLCRLNMDDSDKDTFLPLKTADLRPFNMESAETELGVHEATKKNSKRGKQSWSPSWIWQRWTVINAAKTPRLKDVFIEGIVFVYR